MDILSLDLSGERWHRAQMAMDKAADGHEWIKAYALQQVQRRRDWAWIAAAENAERRDPRPQDPPRNRMERGDRVARRRAGGKQPCAPKKTSR